MRGSLVSAEVLEPYAEALMSIAQSQNLTDRIGEDVNYLSDLLKSSEELRLFLSNPIVESQAKKAVLQQLAGEQVHPYTMNILKLLVDRRRILFLEGICEHFKTLLRQIKQTALAEVISAVELTEAQQQAITEKVKALSGAHQVELKTKIDQDLIGGVIIKVGSQVLDASLRGQLRRIGMRLSAG
ncbi:ATP synthase F1 subunit delta [Argonema antarcticum]|uniref:ATP synthase F1 subunit delta n=1 Tax=Argonema antarcticum TaxID=2942763 RepID=UPI00201349D0|nr:ATP synthase F1 subunit delta [Argonema antarcticum]MCL1472966.1 F0F1 ATP synthase subunit delta [Argonema antarcticum A004/B2]